MSCMTQAHTRILTPAELSAAAAPPPEVFAAASSLPPVPPRGPQALPALAGAISAAADPQAAAAAAGSAMAAAETPFPDQAPGIYDSLVRLPGGLLLGNDQAILTAEVRELTGADEEKMARAISSNNLSHFLDTLLACGTVRLGDRSPAEVPQLLPRLLVGDREMLALAIRIATYGEEFEVLDYTCPLCGGTTARISFPLLPGPDADIRLRTLRDPSDAFFEVPLRRGATALVRLPSGEDQNHLAGLMNLTVTERNSALLRRCLVKVIEPSGIERIVEAQPSIVLSMSAADRRTLLREITERQPGPQFSVKFQHLDCGKEVSLPVTLSALFLG